MDWGEERPSLNNLIHYAANIDLRFTIYTWTDHDKIFKRSKRGKFCNICTPTWARAHRFIDPEVSHAPSVFQLWFVFDSKVVITNRATTNRLGSTNSGSKIQTKWSMIIIHPASLQTNVHSFALLGRSLPTVHDKQYMYTKRKLILITLKLQYKNLTW